jgi:hypothetical protein
MTDSNGTIPSLDMDVPSAAPPFVAFLGMSLLLACLFWLLISSDVFVAAAACYGLTQFGFAILFHIVWAICGAAGWVPYGTKAALTRAVVYITIIPVAVLAFNLWTARAQVRIGFSK